MACPKSQSYQTSVSTSNSFLVPKCSRMTCGIHVLEQKSKVLLWKEKKQGYVTGNDISRFLRLQKNHLPQKRIGPRVLYTALKIWTTTDSSNSSIRKERTQFENGPQTLKRHLIKEDVLITSKPLRGVAHDLLPGNCTLEQN